MTDNKKGGLDGVSRKYKWHCQGNTDQTEMGGPPPQLLKMKRSTKPSFVKWKTGHAIITSTAYNKSHAERSRSILHIDFQIIPVLTPANHHLQSMLGTAMDHAVSLCYSRGFINRSRPAWHSEEKQSAGHTS